MTRYGADPGLWDCTPDLALFTAQEATRSRPGTAPPRRTVARGSGQKAAAAVGSWRPASLTAPRKRRTRPRRLPGHLRPAALPPLSPADSGDDFSFVDMHVIRAPGLLMLDPNSQGELGVRRTVWLDKAPFGIRIAPGSALASVASVSPSGAASGTDVLVPGALLLAVGGTAVESVQHARTLLRSSPPLRLVVELPASVAAPRRRLARSALAMRRMHEDAEAERRGQLLHALRVPLQIVAAQSVEEVTRAGFESAALSRHAFLSDCRWVNLAECRGRATVLAEAEASWTEDTTRARVGEVVALERGGRRGTALAELLEQQQHGRLCVRLGVDAGWRRLQRRRAEGREETARVTVASRERRLRAPLNVLYGELSARRQLTPTEAFARFCLLEARSRGACSVVEAAERVDLSGYGAVAEEQLLRGSEERAEREQRSDGLSAALLALASGVRDSVLEWEARDRIGCAVAFGYATEDIYRRGCEAAEAAGRADAPTGALVAAEVVLRGHREAEEAAEAAGAFTSAAAGLEGLRRPYVHVAEAGSRSRLDLERDDGVPRTQLRTQERQERARLHQDSLVGFAGCHRSRVAKTEDCVRARISLESGEGRARADVVLQLRSEESPLELAALEIGRRQSIVSQAGRKRRDCRFTEQRARLLVSAVAESRFVSAAEAEARGQLPPPPIPPKVAARQRKAVTKDESTVRGRLKEGEVTARGVIRRFLHISVIAEPRGRHAIASACGIFYETGLGPPRVMALEEGGRSSLAEREYTAVVELAIRCHESDPQGMTALHRAAARGDTEAVQSLLAAIDRLGGADARALALAAAASDGQTPLHLGAAGFGDVGALSALLWPGCARTTDRRGRTALHVACERGRVSLVGFLVTTGCDPAAAASQGETALHTAVQHPAFTRKSLRKLVTPAALAAVDHNGATALHAACSRGRVPAVTALLDVIEEQKLTQAAPARMKDGLTVLHLAAAEPVFGTAEGAECLRRLVAAGAEIDAEDCDGATPLHLALANGAPDVAERLLALGASIHARGGSGLLPLHVWALVPGRSDHSALAEGLVGKDGELLDSPAADGSAPLHVAARAGNAGAMRWLLRTGADRRALTKLGKTPLHLVAAAGKAAPEMLAVLCGTPEDAARAGITHTDEHGFTPLHCAAERGDANVLALLVEAGGSLQQPAGAVADVSPKDSTSPGHGAGVGGVTAMHIAAGSEGFDTPEGAAVLTRLGGSGPLPQCADGATPLHWAAERGRAIVAAALLSQHGAEQYDKRQRLPLHYAAGAPAFAAKPKIFRALVPSGGVNHADTGGWTALHVAAKTGQVRQAVELLSCGADANARTVPTGKRRPRTPLHFAAESDNVELVRAVAAAAGPAGLAATDMHTSPLHVAAAARSVAVCRELVSIGASRTLRDSDGATPLHVAVAAVVAAQASQGMRDLLSLLATPEALAVLDSEGLTPAGRCKQYLPARECLEQLGKARPPAAQETSEQVAETAEEEEEEEEEDEEDEEESEFEEDEDAESLDPLPEGWAEYSNPQGIPYYHNAAKGVTQWERPTGSKAGSRTPSPKAKAEPETASGQRSVGASQKPPLPAGWREYTDSHGRVYYHNAATSATQWQRPTS